MLTFRNKGVSVLFGSVSLISSVVLETTDFDSSPDQLRYVILSLPTKGHLQLKQCNLPEVNDYDLIDANWITLAPEHNFSQEDINTNCVRYIHTGSSHDEGGDKFVFHVTDELYRTPKQTFTISVLNTKTEDITLHNNVLTVREGSRRIINEQYLTATQGTTSPRELSFYITGAPLHGFLSLSGNDQMVIDSFNQQEVIADKLLYTHNVANELTSSSIRNDRFYYTVMSTGRNGINRTRSGVFRINIEPLDRELPTLDTLMPLTVVQSYEELISSANLHVSDPDTPTYNITYIVTDSPVHGEILNNGAPLLDESFTQYDLDQERISYRSNTSDDVGIDFFLFTLTDNHHNGYLINGTFQLTSSFFSILIQPLSKEIPKLRKNISPQELEFFGKEKYGFTISQENLWATQPLSEPEGIVYTLLVRPEHGILYNKVCKNI